MKRVADWWFSPAPAERLAALRILIGGYAFWYLWVRFGEFLSVSRLPVAQWKGVGVTAWSGPLPSGVVIALVVATMIALGAFVLGAGYRYVAPVAAVLLLFVTTYRNSFGMVFHTENLMVLHIAALALSPASDVWSIDRWRGWTRTHEAGYGWAIKLLVALTAAAYMLAGIAKLRIAGLDWIDGELLRNQIAIDNLRKALLGDAIAPLATQFLEHPRLFTAFSALTLGLELGAPLALLGGKVARLWALMVWGFHLGVVLLMNIWFLYPLVFVAFLPVFHCERPIAWVIKQVRDRRRTGMRPA
ncbi:MAG: HTTM domain-containing protein [Myxococcota bacterium]|nr:HTTM domain-containing protein [Deltaproteobacteria bacterium]MDQ3340148.1 HTTM domain-containing protein [Myxococcota bacterium]